MRYRNLEASPKTVKQPSGYKFKFDLISLNRIESPLAFFVRYFGITLILFGTALAIAIQFLPAWTMSFLLLVDIQAGSSIEFLFKTIPLLFGFNSVIWIIVYIINYLLNRNMNKGMAERMNWVSSGMVTMQRYFLFIFVFIVFDVLLELLPNQIGMLETNLSDRTLFFIEMSRAFNLVMGVATIITAFFNAFIHSLYVPNPDLSKIDRFKNILAKLWEKEDRVDQTIEISTTYEETPGQFQPEPVHIPNDIAMLLNPAVQIPNQSVPVYSCMVNSEKKAPSIYKGFGDKFPGFEEPNKRAKRLSKLLTLYGVALIIIAIGIMIHQLIVWNHGWEWQDVLHHEVFAICFVFLAIILFILKKSVLIKPIKTDKTREVYFTAAGIAAATAIGISAGIGGIAGGMHIANKIVDNNRWEFLEHLPMQNLDKKQESELRGFFRDHQFYVTQFPDTPSEVFPLAVRVLYDLLKYHGKEQADVKLREQIRSQLLHIAKIQKESIEFDTPIWTEENLLSLLKHNSKQQILNFLRSTEILKLIFAIQDEKTIDIEIFRALGSGRVDLEPITIHEDFTIIELYRFLTDNQFIIHIYDSGFGWDEIRIYNQSDIPDEKNKPVQSFFEYLSEKCKLDIVKGFQYKNPSSIHDKIKDELDWFLSPCILNGNKMDIKEAAGKIIVSLRNSEPFKTKIKAKRDMKRKEYIVKSASALLIDSLLDSNPIKAKIAAKAAEKAAAKTENVKRDSEDELLGNLGFLIFTCQTNESSEVLGSGYMISLSGGPQDPEQEIMLEKVSKKAKGKLWGITFDYIHSSQRYDSERKMLVYLLSKFKPDPKLHWEIFLYSENLFCDSCQPIIEDVCGALSIQEYVQLNKDLLELHKETNSPLYMKLKDHIIPTSYYNDNNQFIALDGVGSIIDASNLTKGLINQKKQLLKKLGRD